MLFLPLSFYHNHKKCFKCPFSGLCKKQEKCDECPKQAQTEEVTPQPREQQQQPTKEEIPEQFKPLILTGASGAGKGTAISYLLEKYPDVFELSISLTTRQPRNQEKDGVDYHFVTVDEFKAEIEKNSFAEWCEVHGNYYGTHYGKLFEIYQRNKIPLLDIDVQGGEKIHAQFPNWNYVFINTPSLEIQEQRLRARNTDSEEQIVKRLKNAVKEVQRLKELEYYSEIVNDQLEEFHKQLSEKIENYYSRLQKQE